MGALRHVMSNGTIGSVLATADYIDHAVPSLDELRAAFDRMAAAKLVEVRWSEVMQERRARLG